MGFGTFGYIEVRDDAQTIEDSEWQVYREIEYGDLPGEVAYLLFGTGVKNGRGPSLFEGRGLPIDATDPVHESYARQRELNPVHGGYYRDTFGHSYVYSGEIPRFILQRIGGLAEAAEEYDHARLLVWFNR